MSSEPLTWPEENRTGIDVIDNQHDRFIAIANEIIRLSEKEKVDKAELKRFWEELVNHTYVHFETEEELLREHAYPKLGEHLASHKLFREKLKTFYFNLNAEQSDPKSTAGTIAEFVRTWAEDHMLNAYNRDVFAFLRSRLS